MIFKNQPEVFAVEQKNFLEKMRHSSSYDLVRKIKTFITTFAAMEGRPEDFSSYLQNFLEVHSLLTASMLMPYKWVGFLNAKLS